MSPSPNNQKRNAIEPPKHIYSQLEIENCPDPAGRVDAILAMRMSAACDGRRKSKVHAGMAEKSVSYDLAH